MLIKKQDTDGIKPDLLEGEFGYDRLKQVEIEVESI